MTNVPCSYPDCQKPQHGLGHCRGHYAQIKRGRPLAPIVVRPDVCTYPSCGRKHYAHNLCRTHYDQGRRIGALSPLPEAPLTVEDRFWNKVARGPAEACWEWLGSKSRGYGYFASTPGRTAPAHRFSYELHHGSIPAGVEIDHMCHNRACVNPSHLRGISREGNVQNLNGARSTSKSGVRGVYQHARSRKWVADATVGGTRHYLGEFETMSEAERVVTTWRRENMPNSLMDCR